MWGWLIRIAVTAVTTALGGYVVSDVYNESQRTQQMQSGKTPTQDTSTSGTFFTWLQSMTSLPRMILWVLVLALAAYIAYLFRGRVKRK